MDVHLSDTLVFDSIAWISSIPDSERGAERRILEDLAAQRVAGGFPLFEYQVQNQIELANALKSVLAEVQRGRRPIIHFYAHGLPDKGLLLAPSGETFPWSALAMLLRDINIATKNSLLTIFGTCHAFHLGKEIDPGKPTFSYLFIAPVKTVSIGFLEDQTARFYRELDESEDIVAAFNRTLAGEMSLFHSQRLLFKALVQYLRKNCMGRAKALRMERMLTLAVAGKRRPSPAQLRLMRKQIRNFLKPDQRLVDRYTKTFMIGRPCGFTFDDVLRHALGLTNKG